MTIKRVGGKYQLRTKDGGRALGPVTSKAAAIRQEVAIKIAQKQRGKK
jgi:hypothetical protein